MGDSGLADLFAVAARPATLPLRGVDDEGDVATGDQVDGIDPVAIGDLADDGVDADPEAGQVVGSSRRSGDTEAKLAQPAGDHDPCGLVAIGERQEDGSLGRQHRAGGELGFVEREPERRVDAHHLTRRPHLRAERWVDFGEAVERQHRFFDRDMTVARWRLQ